MDPGAFGALALLLLVYVPPSVDEGDAGDGEEDCEEDAE